MSTSSSANARMITCSTPIALVTAADRWIDGRNISSVHHASIRSIASLLRSTQSFCHCRRRSQRISNRLDGSGGEIGPSIRVAGFG